MFINVNYDEKYSNMTVIFIHVSLIALLKIFQTKKVSAQWSGELRLLREGAAFLSYVRECLRVLSLPSSDDVACQRKNDACFRDGSEKKGGRKYYVAQIFVFFQKKLTNLWNYCNNSGYLYWAIFDDSLFEYLFRWFFGALIFRRKTYNEGRDWGWSHLPVSA
jgi:hypothetical protein